MRYELLSVNLPLQSTRWFGAGLCFSSCVIEEDSDETAEDEECDDEEEADVEMGVLSIDDEAGVVEAGDTDNYCLVLII